MESDENLKGEAAARKMAEGEKKEDEELDEEFLDFADLYKEEFKKTAPSGFGTSPLAEKELPPRFEDVSLCMDCRHCHQVTVPINVRIPVGETGQRVAMGKVRRCLLGLKLPSDDSPEALSAVRKGAQVAPLAVDCTHFSPWTDAELDDMESRRERHRERMIQRREEQEALEKDDENV